MTKFYGSIGFIKQEKVSKGVYEPVETIRPYYGDILSSRRKWTENDQTVNSDLTINNVISILADRFATDNLGAMRWIEVHGTKWKIDSVELKYPRIEITMGGVYNGGN